MIILGDSMKQRWTNNGKFRLPVDLRILCDNMSFERKFDFRLLNYQGEKRRYFDYALYPVRDVDKIDKNVVIQGNLSYSYQHADGTDDYEDNTIVISELFLEYVRDIYPESKLAAEYRYYLNGDGDMSIYIRYLHEELFEFIKNEYILSKNFDLGILKPLMGDLTLEEKRKIIRKYKIILPFKYYLAIFKGYIGEYDLITSLNNYSDRYSEECNVEEAGSDYFMSDVESLNDCEIIREEIKVISRRTS